MIITNEIVDALIAIGEAEKAIAVERGNTDQIARLEQYLIRITKLRHRVGEDVPVIPKINITAVTYLAVKTAKDSGNIDPNSLKNIGFQTLHGETQNCVANTGTYQLTGQASVTRPMNWVNETVAATSYDSAPRKSKNLLDIIVTLVLS